MAILLCYDIENDTLRTKLSKKLLELGFERLQKSVFLGKPSEALLRQLLNFIKNNILIALSPQDNILYLQLTDQTVQNIVFMPREPTVFTNLIEPPDTIFI